MAPERRQILAGLTAAAVAPVVGAVGAVAGPSAAHDSRETPVEETTMFGLIGKMTTQPGKRDELAAILLEGVSGMPGCLSYVVAQDPEDADALWITEVWVDEEHHRASLSLPSVQAAIAKGRPLITGFPVHQKTVPLGGHGLSNNA
jgi:quinol monooxygenase YgiN